MIHLSTTTDSNGAEIVVTLDACGDTQFGDMTTASSTADTDGNAIGSVDGDVNLNIDTSIHAEVCEGASGSLATDTSSSPTMPPIITNNNGENAMIAKDDSACDKSNAPKTQSGVNSSVRRMNYIGSRTRRSNWALVYESNYL